MFTYLVYQFANTSLLIITLVISCPLVANVLPIINLPMSLENLPIASNGLPLVPIGSDIRVIDFWIFLSSPGPIKPPY